MPFCTECGYRLPDKAVFCPNCGKTLLASALKPADEEVIREENNNQPENLDEPSPTSRYYAPSDRPEHYYGYPSSASANFSTKKEASSGSSKAAVIAILSIVAVLMIITVLYIKYATANKSFVGYWESYQVDVGSGYGNELSGNAVQGMLGLQLYEDSTFELLSAFESEIITGKWLETSNGISITAMGKTFFLDYFGGKLICDFEGYTFMLERSKRSIDEPLLRPGEYGNYGLEYTPPSQQNGGLRTVAGSGTVDNDDFKVVITGAEDFADVDNKSAIRIYYEFTNNSDYTQSAWDALDWEIIQNGQSLKQAYSWDYDDEEVYMNDLSQIRPGITIQCCIQYSYNPKGGNIDLTFFGWSTGRRGGVVSCTYVPDSLPGAPSLMEIAAVPDPKWTTSLDSEGSLSKNSCYASVVKAQLLEDYYGEPAVRIYYEITNNSGHERTFSELVYSYTYQDGVSLTNTYAKIDSETDEAFYATIAPGATVTVSRVFVMRNQTSNVEAEVNDYYTYDAIGETFKIK